MDVAQAHNSERTKVKNEHYTYTLIYQLNIMFIFGHTYSYRKSSMSFELSESLFKGKFNAEHNSITDFSIGGFLRRFMGDHF